MSEAQEQFTILHTLAWDARENETIISPSFPDSVQRDLPSTKEVSRKHFVNKLNLLHFRGGDLYGLLVHERYGRKLVISLKPLPCTEKKLDCLWEDGAEDDVDYYAYNLVSLFFEDGPNVLYIPLEKENITGKGHITGKGISVLLPETGYQHSIRRMKRYSTGKTRAEVLQNGMCYTGALRDFSAESFRVDLEPAENSFRWLNEEEEVQLVLTREQGTLYSSSCTILHTMKNGRMLTCVFQPVSANIPRFPHLEHRSSRYTLELSPDCVFVHPLSGTKVERKVYDVSGTGISVLEDPVDSQLLPGMIIPNIRLIFPNRTGITGKAQVVYRDSDHSREEVRCGIALLEISPEDHLVLLSTLHQSEDPHSYLSKRVDMKELWRFFFESGFIYPQKYLYMQQNRENIKKNYEKLYNACPEFARHFIYQKDSTILGHLSMFRFYPKCWLIQHHASDLTHNHNAGIAVLNQAGSFSHDARRFESMNMDYLLCYYRPNNKFPNKVFGGLARSMRDPKKCSIDPCAYFHLHLTEPVDRDEYSLWSVEEPSREDLMDLNDYYESISGGLMLRALDLLPDSVGASELGEEYEKIGITRRIFRYAIKKNDILNAIIQLNVSDLGLNFSELTNSMMIFAFPNSEVSINILSSICRSTAARLSSQKVPVLMFPESFASLKCIPFEKTYTLWAVDTKYSEEYFKYMNFLFHRINK